jgi:hypothetical protein
MFSPFSTTRKLVEFENELQTIRKLYEEHHKEIQRLREENQRLKKDIFYLVNYLYRYGLHPANDTFAGKIQKTVEYWFDKRFVKGTPLEEGTTNEEIDEYVNELIF